MATRDIPFIQLMKAGYNRGIKRKHVDEIKNDFHEDMVQPAIVSFRSGAYYIIDHQHQSQAIYELNGCDPNTLITCEVRTGLSYEEEADLYCRLNTGSKPLSKVEKIIGLVESGDTKALEFRDVVQSCGYVLGGDTNNTLKAAGTAWGIFEKKDGADILSKILAITSESWPNTRGSAQATVILGLQMFLRHHESEYKRERLIKTLSRVDPSTIAKRGDTYCKQMDSKSFTKQYCTYSVMVDCYNTSLRTNRIEAVPANRA